MKVAELLDLIDFTDSGIGTLTFMGKDCEEAVTFFQPCKALDGIKDEEIDSFVAIGQDEYEIWLKER